MSTPAAARATRALVDITPLRSSPAFRRLWIGSTVSTFGGQMTFIAVMFQIWHDTGSPIWSGSVGLAQAAPLIVFGLFAGSIVDRAERRRLLLTINAGQAACSILLAVQGFLGSLPVVTVLVLLAVQSTLGAGGAPAARTYVKRLLPDEEIAAGLALQRIGWQGSMLIGPALGGLFIGWLGVGGCYLIDAATFAAGLWGLAGLPRARPENGAARPGIGGVVDGLAFLVRTPIVRGALLTDLAATVLSMPISLFPLLNAERFGNDPRTLGLFLTAIAVGGVAASLFSGTFTRLPRPGLVMLVGSASWGVSLAALGFLPYAWTALACLVVAGAADTVAVVSRATIVQLHTPDALLGRVSAAEQIVGTAGPDLGNLRGGVIAGFASGAVALVTGGLACVAAVGLIAMSAPGLVHGSRSGEGSRSSVRFPA